MKIIINNTNKESDEKIEGILCHDNVGNVFLEISNSYYLLLINAENDIEFIEVCNFDNLPSNYEQSIPHMNYEISNTYDKNSLREKVIKDLEEHNSDDELDEDGYKVTKYKNYPEDKLYITNTKDIQRKDEYDDYDDYTEPKCIIACCKENNTTNILPLINKTLENPPVYDFLVIDEESKQVLKTLELDEKAGYRITIFTSYKIVLNIVGSKLKMYNILFSRENEIINIVMSLVSTNIII